MPLAGLNSRLNPGVVEEYPGGYRPTVTVVCRLWVSQITSKAGGNENCRERGHAVRTRLLSLVISLAYRVPHRTVGKNNPRSEGDSSTGIESAHD